MLIALLSSAMLGVAELPVGSAPIPVAFPYFPDPVHAYVWRNWTLVPLEHLAAAVGAERADLLRMGRAMGLAEPPEISEDQQRRSYITIIRRNWHLLPYDQLLQILDWTPEQLAFTLREDDFLYYKLGGLKPRCEPLRYAPPDERTLEREREIARIVREEFPDGVGEMKEPLFHFVDELSSKPKRAAARRVPDTSLRLCYSYFALCGDPLLDPKIDPYPEGYLARLAAAGVNGVWLHSVLYRLAPYPWDATRSDDWVKRLAALQALVARAQKYGIRVFLYVNEPRAMPVSFFSEHRDLRGVTEGDHAAICTSVPEVQRYLRDSIATICKTVPELGGFFTITASENLTNCWSHGRGHECPRCGQRKPAEVIAEVNRLIAEGIAQASSKARLIAWDWGWHEDWVADIIAGLPATASLMSVSEWDIPITRGGVKSVIGEYSVSAVGPGPRAERHWALARQRELKTLAKIQANCSWELSAVPYIPAVQNVAEHIENLRHARVSGLMLGWTLGGYPSPNLEVIAEINRPRERHAPGDPLFLNAAQAMYTVAARRYGEKLAPAVVNAWQEYSAAFAEFPFHIGLVYSAPMQFGPANPLWAEPTGYQATMVGFPYDDLDTWRQVYPPEIFIAQFEKVATGFERARQRLQEVSQTVKLGKSQRANLALELHVAEAAAIHFRSVANQARFIVARRAAVESKDRTSSPEVVEALETVLRGEIGLAKRLYAIQTEDSRIGFEASNQYYYVPLDLVEKVLNARTLLRSMSSQ